MIFGIQRAIGEPASDFYFRYSRWCLRSALVFGFLVVLLILVGPNFLASSVQTFMMVCYFAFSVGFGMSIFACAGFFLRALFALAGPMGKRGDRDYGSAFRPNEHAAKSALSAPADDCVGSLGAAKSNSRKKSMHQKIHESLAALNWREGEPPPVVDFHLYFEGNHEEECIAPNKWGHGRPPIAELYARFREIAAMRNVERVLVGLHPEWNDEDYADSYPPAENVHIFTTASKSEVEVWLEGLACDGVVKGWPYGRPKNAPDPAKGNVIYSICWD